MENNLDLEIFKESEDDHKFAVMLKTISEIKWKVETAMKYLTSQIPSRWFCPEVATTIKEARVSRGFVGVGEAVTQ